jgi:hypothetical protein
LRSVGKWIGKEKTTDVGKQIQEVLTRVFCDVLQRSLFQFPVLFNGREVGEVFEIGAVISY